MAPPQGKAHGMFIDFEHSILRPSLGTVYKFQGLLHCPFDTNYITTKSILTKIGDIVIKELRTTNNCTLKSNPHIRSELTSMKLIHTMSHSVRPLVVHFKFKQKYCNDTMHRLFTEDIE